MARSKETTSIGFEISRELAERLHQDAAADDRSVSSLIRKIIEAYYEGEFTVPTVASKSREPKR